METKLYEGFGKKFPAAEWAKRLNLSVSAFYFYANVKGLTVEELFALRGISYYDTKARGRHMQATHDLMVDILCRSGFFDTAPLRVASMPSRAYHIIWYKDERLGEYFYHENRLVLSNGEGLLLDRLDPETVRIIRRDALWAPHPDLKKALLT